jgi:hypothetical protein
MGIPFGGFSQSFGAMGLSLQDCGLHCPEMTTLPINELSTRTREIFRLVVEGYLASGQAIGSKALARRAAYQCRAPADRTGPTAVRGRNDAGG